MKHINRIFENTEPSIIDEVKKIVDENQYITDKDVTDDKLVEYSKFQIGKIDEYNNIENVSENINIKILLYYLLLTGKNTNTVNNINRVIKNDSDCKLAIGNILTSLYQSEIIDE